MKTCRSAYIHDNTYTVHTLTFVGAFFPEFPHESFTQAQKKNINAGLLFFFFLYIIFVGSTGPVYS